MVAGMSFEKGTFIARNIADPNYKDSSRYGFRVRWPVASEYQIVDGLLLPKPSATWRDSYPIVHENIPGQLARIREGDEKALLSFAKQHGGFGFIHLLPLAVPFMYLWGRNITVSDVLAEPVGFTHLSEGQHDEVTKSFLKVQMERLRKDKRAIRDIGIECGITDKQIWSALIEHRGGDPLPWIWAHIRGISLCCALTEHIQNEDEEWALSYLKQFNQDSDVLQKIECELVPTCEVAFRHRIASHAWFKPVELKDWSVLDFARYIRRQLINKNIDGIRVAIEPIGQGESSFLEYRSLIEVAYWHLHNRVVDGRMRRCARKECGAFFVQTDKRQKYCPEPTTGPTQQSLCGVRDRGKLLMRKRRQKLKKQQQKR